MADVLTTTTTLANLLPIYLERRLLARLVPLVRFYQFSEKYPIPQKEGKQITFNGWVNIAAASSTLGEGTANSLVELSARKVNVTTVQYGRGVKLTDFVALTAITDLVKGAVDTLSTSAALTLDNVQQLAIFKNVLAQTGTLADAKTKILSVFMSSPASAFSANTGTMNASNKQFGFPAVFGTSTTRLSAVSKTAATASARMSIYSIRRGRNRLSKLDALPFSDGYFVAVAHPNAVDTLKRDPSWKDWNQYVLSKETMYKGEIGMIEQVRIVQSTNAPRYAVAAHSVNITAILGQGAVGSSDVDGGIKMIVKNPGPSSTDNPFDQWSTVAYKLNAVAAVLNPSAGCILFTEEVL